MTRPLPIMTIAVCAIAIAVSVGGMASPQFGDWVGANLLADAFVVFGGRYWLVTTTPFIHLILPHLVINILTMTIYGTVAERNFSHGLVLAVFLTGAVVSMIALLQEVASVYGVSYAFGISGGVCAVFGFLCVAHKPMLHPTSWRHWLLIAFYPAILIWLYIVEIRGVTPTGTVPHVVGLVIGALIGLATRPQASRVVQALPIALSALALGSLVWSPWATPWQAAHGKLPTLTVGNTEAPPASGTAPQPRALFFINGGWQSKYLYWMDAAGKEHPAAFTTRVPGYEGTARVARPTWSTATMNFDSRPRALSDRWVLRAPNGALIAYIDLASNPHRALIVDLRHTATHDQATAGSATRP